MGGYLGLYLKNRRKMRFMKERVNSFISFVFVLKSIHEFKLLHVDCSRVLHIAQHRAIVLIRGRRQVLCPSIRFPILGKGDAAAMLIGHLNMHI